MVLTAEVASLAGMRSLRGELAAATGSSARDTCAGPAVVAAVTGCHYYYYYYYRYFYCDSCDSL